MPGSQVTALLITRMSAGGAEVQQRWTPSNGEPLPALRLFSMLCFMTLEHIAPPLACFLVVGIRRKHLGIDPGSCMAAEPRGLAAAAVSQAPALHATGTPAAGAQVQQHWTPGPENGELLPALRLLPMPCFMTLELIAPLLALLVDVVGVRRKHLGIDPGSRMAAEPRGVAAMPGSQVLAGGAEGEHSPSLEQSPAAVAPTGIPALILAPHQYLTPYCMCRSYHMSLGAHYCSPTSEPKALQSLGWIRFKQQLWNYLIVVLQTGLLRAHSHAADTPFTHIGRRCSCPCRLVWIPWEPVMSSAISSCTEEGDLVSRRL